MLASSVRTTCGSLDEHPSASAQGTPWSNRRLHILRPVKHVEIAEEPSSNACMVTQQMASCVTLQARAFQLVEGSLVTSDWSTRPS
jgi:hypothetical protein